MGITIALWVTEIRGVHQHHDLRIFVLIGGEVSGICGGCRRVSRHLRRFVLVETDYHPLPILSDAPNRDTIYRCLFCLPEEGS